MPVQRRRRAVGPRGAAPPEESGPAAVPGPLRPDPAPRREAREDDDERLRAERPPHHDRGV